MTSPNISGVSDGYPVLEEPQAEVPPHQKKIPLVEVFGPTVQGEGAVIGQQTYFLRFGLCDYKCKMCDSMHAVDPHQVRANAKWLTQQDIYDAFITQRQKTSPASTPWVTFSGGNPCIHNLRILVNLLHAGDFSIQVETQGTFCPEWLADCDAICVSPKGPGMGERLELGKLDDFLRMITGHPGLYLKIVIFDERDLEVARMLFERYVLDFKCLRPSQFFLSLGNPFPPGYALLEGEDRDLPTILMALYKSILDEIMHDKTLCRVRFLPQMHVLLWGNKQGV